MKFIFALVAASLAIIGNVPYLHDMFRGKVKPHPYTWLIWSIVSGVTFAGQWIGGAGWALIAFGASEIFTFIIFIFSLKYGFKNIPREDTWFLIIAILGLIPWMITKDPTVSVIIMVTIDCIAFIPTIKKGWRHAHTENVILYQSNILRHVLALLALRSYNIATMFHSVAMIITNSIMVFELLTHKKK